jgi:hypothetical protein
MPRYAELVYNGFWFSPEREALQQLVDKTQEYCTGTWTPPARNPVHVRMPSGVRSVWFFACWPQAL